ncbi:MAG TPA: IS630 family transposase [Streptosporangiaceae bacterium]|nr:IS630 family transposase [Streptosporangiaceae bacterium]
MSGSTRAVAVRVTIKRRRKLNQIIAAATSPQRLVLRAKIVLAAAAGKANPQIARDLGCSVGMVRTWRRRFACRGIPGLFDKPRCGRPETYGPSQRLAIVATATSTPPDGESQWSQAMIAGHLAGRGLAVSPATVGRVLAEAKVRPHKVRGWLNRADDDTFWLRAGAVCRLYLDPPPGTVLVSVDEKTGIQAKSRKHPQIPARPGRDARREFEYVRHGTVSILAAMNVTTGEIIAERIDRNDSQTFISFLVMLHQAIPPHLRIHLIMDNGSSHTSAATRSWLAARPRFQVTYTPKHASWLNMIEQWFGVLTRRLLRRGEFTSRDDLEAKITAFTIRYNKNARPYQWSYDADADHARYLARHHDPQSALPEAA